MVSFRHVECCSAFVSGAGNIYMRRDHSCKRLFDETSYLVCEKCPPEACARPRMSSFKLRCKDLLCATTSAQDLRHVSIAIKHGKRSGSRRDDRSLLLRAKAESHEMPSSKRPSEPSPVYRSTAGSASAKCAAGLCDAALDYRSLVAGDFVVLTLPQGDSWAP